MGPSALYRPKHPASGRAFITIALANPLPRPAATRLNGVHELNVE